MSERNDERVGAADKTRDSRARVTSNGVTGATEWKECARNGGRKKEVIRGVGEGIDGIKAAACGEEVAGGGRGRQR